MILLNDKVYEILKGMQQASDIKQLNLAFKAALLLMGINSYSYSHYTYHPRAKQKLKYEQSSDHFAAWHQHYLVEQYEEIDTTLHTCYLSTEPFVWHLEEQLKHAKSAREKQMRLDSIEYGIMGGISIPIHGPNNDFAHLIVVEMNSEPPFLNQAEKLMPVLYLLALYYYHAILRLLPEQLNHSQSSLFSKRELACLSLVAKRLSVAEIAKKMQITERTVHFHIQNVNKKLGVANKFDAVNKALEMGLVVL